MLNRMMYIRLVNSSYWYYPYYSTSDHLYSRLRLIASLSHFTMSDLVTKSQVANFVLVANFALVTKSQAAIIILATMLYPYFTYSGYIITNTYLLSSHQGMISKIRQKSF